MNAGIVKGSSESEMELPEEVKTISKLQDPVSKMSEDEVSPPNDKYKEQNVNDGEVQPELMAQILLGLESQQQATQETSTVAEPPADINNDGNVVVDVLVLNIGDDKKICNSLANVTNNVDLLSSGPLSPDMLSQHPKVEPKTSESSPVDHHQIPESELTENMENNDAQNAEPISSTDENSCMKRCSSSSLGMESLGAMENDEVFEEDVAPKKRGKQLQTTTLLNAENSRFDSTASSVHEDELVGDRTADADNRKFQKVANVHYVIIEVKGCRYKVPSLIRCHLCDDLMRLCLRRTRYRGERREYPAYRCNRKGCQTFRSIRKVFEHPISPIRLNNGRENDLVTMYLPEATLAYNTSLPDSLRPTCQKRSGSFNEFQEQLKRDIIANKAALESSRRSNHPFQDANSCEQGTLLYFPKVLTPRQLVDIQTAVVHAITQNNYGNRQLSVFDLPIFSHCPFSAEKLQSMLRNPESLENFSMAMSDSPQPPLPQGYEMENNGRLVKRESTSPQPTFGESYAQSPPKRTMTAKKRPLESPTTDGRSCSVLRTLLEKPPKMRRAVTTPPPKLTPMTHGRLRKTQSALANAYMQRNKELEQVDHHGLPPRSTSALPTFNVRRADACTSPQFFAYQSATATSSSAASQMPSINQFFNSPTTFSIFAPNPPVGMNMNMNMNMNMGPPPRHMTLCEALQQHYPNKAQRPRPAEYSAFIPPFYQSQSMINEPLLMQQLLQQTNLPPSMVAHGHSEMDMDRAELSTPPPSDDTSNVNVTVVDQDLQFDPPLLGEADDEQKPSN